MSEMTAQEAAEFSGAPRVEEVICRVMKRFPGTSKMAQAQYYEEVHQELAPLARELERENIALRRQLGFAQPPAMTGRDDD
jgi:hypothetical protein